MKCLLIVCLLSSSAYAVSFKEIKDSPVVKAAENLVKEINDSAPVSSIKATCKEIDEHRITSALKALITGYMSYWSFYMVYKALGKCGKNSIFHVAAAVGGMSYGGYRLGQYSWDNVIKMFEEKKELVS